MKLNSNIRTILGGGVESTKITEDKIFKTNS